MFTLKNKIDQEMQREKLYILHMSEYFHLRFGSENKQTPEECYFDAAKKSFFDTQYRNTVLKKFVSL